MSQRLGLVIGNSLYRDSTLARLASPDADVGDLADVLLNQEVGNFDDVKVLVNVSNATARRAISDFFSDKSREDLLLLYFSCHGVLDENGRLYLAFKDTERQLLRATAIPAAFITDEMNASRSQRQVLVLDCCHSGAFARGTKGAIGAPVGTAAAFEGTGYGRVVLTATDATQYAWEDDQISGASANSLFTRFLVQGLQTGEADRNRDGRITINELYDYIYERVVKQTPRQTPGKWSYKEQGEIVIAKNPLRADERLPTPDAIEFNDELEKRLARYYMRGLSAYWLEEWGKAEKVFQEIRKLRPDYRDVAAKLNEVQRQKKWAGLYQQALEASQAEEWDRVVTALQKIVAELPEYKDVKDRLKAARRQATLSDLTNQAEQLFQARQWQAVINVFERIREIDPTYQDPAQYYARAQQELATDNRQKELEKWYYQALQALEAGQWLAARANLLKVRETDPEFSETRRLLERIETELAPGPAPTVETPEPAMTDEEPAASDQAASLGMKSGQASLADRAAGFPLKWLRQFRRLRQREIVNQSDQAAFSEELVSLANQQLWRAIYFSAAWFLTKSCHLMAGLRAGRCQPGSARYQFSNFWVGRRGGWIHFLVLFAAVTHPVEQETGPDHRNWLGVRLDGVLPKLDRPITHLRKIAHLYPGRINCRGGNGLDGQARQAHISRPARLDHCGGQYAWFWSRRYPYQARFR